MTRVIAYLLVVHFVADFLLQPREMATQKSVNPKWLYGHLAIQCAMFGIALGPFYGDKALLFAFCNSLVHGLIDWNIWRLYKLSVVKRYPELNWSDPEQAKQWDFWNDSWFFHTIGLDQMLHGLTLVLLAGALL
jgi:hypothetical protein